MGYIVVSPGDEIYINKNKAKDVMSSQIIPEGSYKVVSTDAKMDDGTYALKISNLEGRFYVVHPGQVGWIPGTGGWQVVFDEQYLPPSLRIEVGENDEG